MKKRNLNVFIENRGNLFSLKSIITMVLMLTFCSVFAQQTKTVDGIVKDEGGVPLPGVTVVVEGTTTGTVTNVDGDFHLELPTNAEMLQFSFVGMKTKDVRIAGNTVFNIMLEAEAIGLEEVVAIGYGTQKKSYSNRLN